MNIRERNIPALLEACLSGGIRDSVSLAARSFKRASEKMEADAKIATAEQAEQIQRAVQFLDIHQDGMTVAFAHALRNEFLQVLDIAQGNGEKRIDAENGELSLVDENELTARVHLSRVRQLVLNATELEIAQLNTYVCAAMGLPNVQPSRNPFRQESYIKALQHVVEVTPVEQELQQNWMRPLGEALGSELALYYDALVQELRTAGVLPVGFALCAAQRSQSAERKSMANTSAADQRPDDEEELERLADQLAYAQFEPEAADTQPLALNGAEASEYISPPSAQVEAAVARVRRMLASLENNPRLHASLRPLVREFERPLRLLVTADPQSFFTEHDHPARGLLDDMTRRSTYYASESDPGFERFLKLAKGTVRYLLALPVHDATAFAHVRRMWNRAWSSSNPDSEILLHGNTNAGPQLVLRIAQEFSNLPAARTAPRQIVHFLTSVWAEVVAKAQLSEDKRHIGRYMTVAPALLWCAQPYQRAEEAQRLLARMETLCASIRLGLNDLQYPQEEIERMTASVAQLRMQLAQAAGVPELHEQVSSLDQYLAPMESIAEVALSEPPDIPTVASPLSLDALTIGQWFELCTQGRCIHTQLTWIGPQGASFIFKAVDGSTQAMTLRMLQKLHREGSVHCIPGVSTKATPLG